MKYQVETQYLAVFGFSLIVCVVCLIIGINKLQPYLFLHIFTSCTAIYDTISTNSLVISALFVVGLLSLLVLLSVKLVLSSYKTSQQLAIIADSTHTGMPHKVTKISKKLGIDKKYLVITNHTRPVAITAGLLSPKIVLSKGLLAMLTEEELEAVMLHELYHQKHRHGLLYVIAEAISTALMFVLPVLQDVTRNMKIDFEVLADQFAVSLQSDTAFVTSALRKLSGKTDEFGVPAFANAVSVRTGTFAPRHRLSVVKVCVSLLMLIGLGFFAIVPVTVQSPVEAQEDAHCTDTHSCANLCVNKIPIGMSKQQNYSSILPASVF